MRQKSFKSLSLFFAHTHPPQSTFNGSVQPAARTADLFSACSEWLLSTKRPFADGNRNFRSQFYLQAQLFYFAERTRQQRCRVPWDRWSKDNMSTFDGSRARRGPTLTSPSALALSMLSAGPLFFFWAGGRSWTQLIWFGTQTPASSPKSGRRSVVTRHHCRFLNLTSSTLSHELTSMHVWCFVELIPCGSTIVLPAATVGLFWPCRTAGLSPVFSQRHTLGSSFRWPCRTCPVSSGVRPGLLLIPHSDNGSPH